MTGREILYWLGLRKRPAPPLVIDTEELARQIRAQAEVLLVSLERPNPLFERLRERDD